jgi:hypothetical protein
MTTQSSTPRVEPPQEEYRELITTIFFFLSDKEKT